MGSKSRNRVNTKHSYMPQKISVHCTKEGLRATNTQGTVKRNVSYRLQNSKCKNPNSHHFHYNDMDSLRFSHQPMRRENCEMLPVSQLKPRYMIQKLNHLNHSYQMQPGQVQAIKENAPTALIVQINPMKDPEISKRSPITKNRMKVTTIEHTTLSLDPNETNTMLRVRNLNNFMNREEYLKDIRQPRERSKQYARDNVNLLNEALRRNHKSGSRHYRAQGILKLDPKNPSQINCEITSKTSPHHSTSGSKNVIIEKFSNNDHLRNHMDIIQEDNDVSHHEKDYFALGCGFKP